MQTKQSDVQGFEKFVIIPGEMIQEMIAGFETGSLYLSKILDQNEQMSSKQDKQD